MRANLSYSGVSRLRSRRIDELLVNHDDGEVDFNSTNRKIGKEVLPYLCSQQQNRARSTGYDHPELAFRKNPV
jgi:hypothetical protein